MVELQSSGRTTLCNCFLDRTPVFTDPHNCRVFLAELEKLNGSWPCKLICYVLMPDHLHMIVNPRDGRIKEFTGLLKAVSAKAIVRENCCFNLAETDLGHQVWARKFQRCGVMEHLDDLAKDQLHTR
jgi:REP element-mobilizing transposase RayT